MATRGRRPAPTRPMPALTTPPRFRTADDDVAAATDRRRAGDHRLGRRLPRERWDFGVGSGRVADEFVPGRALSSAFYAEVVAPLLHARPHSAALLGRGSDVLGFDTTVSTDHGWGPRMHVYVGPSDVDAVRRDRAAGLPKQFRGWPVRFGWDGVPTQHHDQVSTLTDWLHNHLGVDPPSARSTGLHRHLDPRRLNRALTARRTNHRCRRGPETFRSCS
jgi:hypothetical protein